MTHRVLGALVVAVVLALGLLLSSPAAAEGPASPPTLAPLQQCEVDRVALQAQVVELRAQLVAAQTQLDRQALATERARIEGTLPTAAGYRWDWTTLRMVTTDARPQETAPTR